MCWGLAPVSELHGTNFPPDQLEEPVASRELLSAVCEPFFEQMLTALHQMQYQRHKGETKISKNAAIQSVILQSFMLPVAHQLGYLNSIRDDDSTEAEDSGAFSSLFSGLSSEGESIDDADTKSVETDVLAPTTPSQTSNVDSEQTSDAEGSSMVCRHWKSKGWCRMESNCKFLHPEHKRGIAAPKVCSRSSKGSSINRLVCPDISTTWSFSDTLNPDWEGVPPVRVAQTRRRGGRGGSKRGQPPQLGNSDKNIAGFIFAGSLEDRETSWPSLSNSMYRTL